MVNCLRFTSYELRIWWRACRPFAYPASIVPAVLGIVVAWCDGVSVNWWLAVFTLMGAVFAHTASNLLNDYVDFLRGVDRPGTFGGSGVLVEGVLTPRAILIASVIFYALALAVALPLFVRVGPLLIVLVTAGFIAGAGYVLPPFRFKYHALGDIAVFTTFAIGITLGAYVIQTKGFSWTPVYYAIPIGLLTSAILHANNMRDRSDDERLNVHTIANLIGPGFSCVLYAAYTLGAYIVLVVFASLGLASPGVLAAFLTLPFALRLTSRVRREVASGSGRLVMVDAQTAQLNLLFGSAMIVGILAWQVLVS